ncbi:Y-family DNA polymerase [Hyalangium rubrum]|uniref:DNA polymerase Y family protein n=1 Tax=Hyalangium rubrum TaxID=3103134 RepID=A0ABU5H515_9BACT|nr:DNA polymerase Y family protein [Hyalangium sp. s54d21]MDY7227862.1 DNA polymerase Y family protein [Hyalangium sp. s54d21]
MRWGYLHFSRFPAQRKVIEVPSLAGQPFALEEEVRGQRRVAFASSSALKVGVRTGMTLTAATALEPSLQHFPYRADDEARALTSLGEALMCVAPGFQLSAPEGMWFDASAAHLFGGEEGLCLRALEVCSGHGYRGRAVVASELFTSRVLARYGTRPVLVVPEGGSARALAPLPLAALEGKESEAFAALGLRTLGEVAALPSGAVTARGGAGALRAHTLCRGGDDTPFVAEVLEEVLEERMTLDWPAESFEPLQFALKTLLDRLCARLAGRRQAAVRLLFTLKLDPTGKVELPLTLARPAARSKLLLDLARHQMADLRLENPVASLSVRVEEHSEDRGQQLVLGDTPEGDAALEVVLSRLATTLGEESLFSAALESVHRPEQAYAARAFRPPSSPRGMAGELLPEAEVEVPVDEVARERPSRLLEQPATLDAEVAESGELLAAWLLGKRRRVTSMAGPERLSGEWWAADPYSRDYYRVHFEGLGPAWVFRDAKDGRFYLQGLFD